MYKRYYDLSEKPFQINTDPHFLWLGANHKEALATLNYGLSSENGFLLMTGDVGAGKTTLVNALLKNLDEDVLVANVSNPKLDLMDFLNHVAKSLGIKANFDNKVNFLFYFQDFLQNISKDHKRVLLIIDEAQKLSGELLEEIRLLSNVEQPEQKIINIFFVGQNELNETLKSSECRALRQRITLNYNVKPLSESETPLYIKHRLKVAGTEEKIFKYKAMREIHEFSGGYPRLINIICDRALLTGYVNALNKITPEVIRECAQELLLPGEAKEDLYSGSKESLIPDDPAPVVEDSITQGKVIDLEGRRDDTETIGTHSFYYATISRNRNASRQIRESVRELKNILQKHISSAGSLATHIWDSVVDLKRQWPKFVAAAASMGEYILDSLFALTEKSLKYSASTLSFIKGKWASSSDLNKRRIKFGALAGPLVILAVIFSYNSSISRSNQPQLASSSTSSSARDISNENNPSSLSMMAFEQALDDSTVENYKANDVVKSHFITESNQHDPSPRKVSTSSLIEKDRTMSLSSTMALEQETASSFEHVDTDHNEGHSTYSEVLLVEQARKALERHDFRQAENLLENDLAKHEEIKELYVQALRGQARLLLKEDTDQAKDLLKKAAKVDPQNAMVYYDLGKLYTHTKDYPKAIEAYLTAIRLDPDSADTFFNLGFNYAAVKNYAYAEKMFLKVTELEPPYLDEAIFNLAMVQYKQGKKQQCVENLERALQVNPENQRARKYLNRFKVATLGSQ